MAFKLTSCKPLQTFVSLQAYSHALLQTWQRQDPCQGVANAKGTNLITNVRVHARVHKLSPSSST
jgi:hypothetical protein